MLSYPNIKPAEVNNFYIKAERRNDRVDQDTGWSRISYVVELSLRSSTNFSNWLILASYLSFRNDDIYYVIASVMIDVDIKKMCWMIPNQMILCFSICKVDSLREGKMYATLSSCVVPLVKF